jgi:hypothetical protein
VSRVGGATAGARTWNAADGLHLDVRGLECPQPLVEVLRTIDDGEVASVTVHLDQEPLLLYAELDDRGWSHDLLPADADGVHLRLTRQHP